MKKELLYVNSEIKMTSKEVADLTGKKHKDVMRDIRVLDSQLGGSKFALSSYESSQGKKVPCYELNKKEVLIIVSGYNVILRSAIIDRWEELELEKQKQFRTPTSFAEALRLAADQQEEIEKQAIQIQEKDQKIKEDSPKVKYFDKILDTKYGITITEIGQQLDVSAVVLNRFLKEKGVQWRQGRKWRLKKAYMGKGLTLTKTHLVEGQDHINASYMMWTERGKQFIFDLVNGKDVTVESSNNKRQMELF